MNDGQPSPDSQPVLRTLAPALRHLEDKLRNWLGGPHRLPLPMMARATIEGVAVDLRRQAEALDADQPLLIIMLMGGTGVGKSTLLNALAGGAIAQASFARPTTRDPVVYYHETVHTDRLDPALRQCRLAPHNRPPLQQKILVDTPDLDSNDLANRDRLMQVLPVADIVLYVGSQEKYHDKLGWELFLQQRRRKAFAFVLNKWDRCQHANATGVRPDHDLLRDLEKEGFQTPLLFRTCAQHWIDVKMEDGGSRMENREAPLPSSILHPQSSPQSTTTPPLPDNEQFPDLVHWLELGLTRLEIEAIKARGVGQLLQHVQEALALACPPDLSAAAEKTRTAWEESLAEEAHADADVLLNTLDPFQREIEHHFTLESQSRFHGLMALYLRLFTRAKYVGSTLRSRIPFIPRFKSTEPAPPPWDLAAFTRCCSDLAATRNLTARGKALANRLLVLGDEKGFPVDMLSEPVHTAANIDWRQRNARALTDSLQHVEQQWSKPTGARRLLQGGIVLLGNWLPPVALVAAFAQLLWRYFDVNGKGYQVQTFDFLLPFIVALVVMVLLQIFIGLLLPLRWSKIRDEFRKELEKRLKADLLEVHLTIPTDVANALNEERRQIAQMQKETREVAVWLQEREQAASIGGLYGRA